MYIYKRPGAYMGYDHEYNIVMYHISLKVPLAHEYFSTKLVFIPSFLALTIMSNAFRGSRKTASVSVLSPFVVDILYVQSTYANEQVNQVILLIGVRTSDVALIDPQPDPLHVRTYAHW